MKIRILLILLISESLIATAKFEKYKKPIIATVALASAAISSSYALYKKYHFSIFNLFDHKKTDDTHELYSNHVHFRTSEKEENKLNDLCVEYEKAITNNRSIGEKFSIQKRYCEYIIELSEKYWKNRKGIMIVYESESWERSVENNIKEFTKNLDKLSISSAQKGVFVSLFNATTFDALFALEAHIEKLGLYKQSPEIVLNLRSLFTKCLIEKELSRRLVVKYKK